MRYVLLVLAVLAGCSECKEIDKVERVERVVYVVENPALDDKLVERESEVFWRVYAKDGTHADITATRQIWSE